MRSPGLTDWPLARGEVGLTASGNQLRLDPLTGRWIAVAEGRSYRPSAFSPFPASDHRPFERPCPFCPGAEEKTPPALETYGPTGTWTVRVVPNLYPAFAGDEPMVSQSKGPVFTSAPASGMHEVLILSQDHKATWADLDDDQIGVVMAAMRDRMDIHAHSGIIRYSQIILNQGRSAGASLEHPHAQLLGISFVPRELVDEQAGFTRFVGGCLLCATSKLESAINQRVVAENENSVIISPYWASTPFEMLVIPKTHGPHMHISSPYELKTIGISIKQTLMTLRNQVSDVAYNLVFHSSPYRSVGNFHWHIHIFPKLTTKAGFELGTGVPINIISPELATSVLKGIDGIDVVQTMESE